MRFAACDQGERRILAIIRRASTSCLLTPHMSSRRTAAGRFGWRSRHRFPRHALRHGTTEIAVAASEPIKVVRPFDGCQCEECLSSPARINRQPNALRGPTRLGRGFGIVSSRRCRCIELKYKPVRDLAAVRLFDRDCVSSSGFLDQRFVQTK